MGQPQYVMGVDKSLDSKKSVLRVWHDWLPNKPDYHAKHATHFFQQQKKLVACLA